MRDCYMRGSRGGGGGGGGGGRGSRPEFLSNTGLDPLKFSKVPRQYSMLDHYRHASEMPFKCCFTGGPIMVAFSGIWILSLKKKKNVRFGPPLAKFSGSAHVLHKSR